MKAAKAENLIPVSEKSEAEGFHAGGQGEGINHSDKAQAHVFQTYSRASAQPHASQSQHSQELKQYSGAIAKDAPQSPAGS